MAKRRKVEKKEKGLGFGLLDLLFPLVTIPIKAPIWMGKTLRDAAIKELTDESRVREELLELQMRYEMDEISKEKYEEKEKALMERLEAIRKYKEE
ncbi:MAG: hypothetical protein AMJ45_04385 [Syntrophobacter sp. DG_60]|nr:MAG: hypothetical protein AMJ45_04385 [Syntrophobacter sp. DG_60]